MGLLVLVPVVCLAAAGIPFALAMVFGAVVGPTDFMSHWLLMNKYIEHFATEAVRSHLWLVAPISVGAWVWRHPVRENSLPSKNAP